MRFIIYGAGAVGGVIGGRLFQHGHEVILIARGAHLEAIRSRGLELQDPIETVRLQVPAVATPRAITFQPGDVVVLAMKTQDTIAALDELAAVAPASLPIVCAQNGVENERLALRRFANVYGMAVMLPGTHLEPGIVQANSAPISGILDTGRYPKGVDAFCTEFTAALERSMLNSRPEPRVMWRKYSKLLLNLGNAIQAALGGDADDGGIGQRARDEAKAVYAAAGIAYASDEEDRERRGNTLQVRPIAGQRRGGGSSWQSLARGKTSIEADYLNGEIVLLGRIHGVPTPVNAMLQHLANRLAREGTPAGALTVADLQRELDEQEGAAVPGA